MRYFRYVRSVRYVKDARYARYFRYVRYVRYLRYVGQKKELLLPSESKHSDHHLCQGSLLRGRW